ncbi:MAG: hypothetical protein H7138_18990 [Myxococcales bacterium]|nr:hypothetical protein [Myxococcales bacterium]
MRKQSWRVIERMHEHFVVVAESALSEESSDDEEESDKEQDEDEADAETAIALAYPLLMRGLGSSSWVGRSGVPSAVSSFS